MAEIFPTNDDSKGLHPVVILSINESSGEITFGSDISIIGGTTKKKNFNQVEVKPSKQNGLDNITYFNISPNWIVNSLEFDIKAHLIGALEEEYFNEIVKRVKEDI